MLACPGALFVMLVVLLLLSVPPVGSAASNHVIQQLRFEHPSSKVNPSKTFPGRRHLQREVIEAERQSLLSPVQDLMSAVLIMVRRQLHTWSMQHRMATLCAMQLALLLYAARVYALAHKRRCSLVRKAASCKLQRSCGRQPICKASCDVRQEFPPRQSDMDSSQLEAMSNQRTQDWRKLLWHLENEVPIFGKKASHQHDIVSDQLPDIIDQHWDDQDNFRAEIMKALEQKSKSAQPSDGWWNFTSQEVSHMPFSDLMSQYHCDGLLDWSRVPVCEFKQEYTYLVVTSGLGPGAMVHEGLDKDWLTSLHRDVLCDWGAPQNLFYIHVDTLVVGLVGRKRVVLLPPEAAVPTWCASGNVDLTCCSGAELRTFRSMTCDHGWDALEQHAREVGGYAGTVCPGTYCLIPSGWWHILRPLDDFTAIVTPTFRQGCWSACSFERNAMPEAAAP